MLKNERCVYSEVLHCINSVHLVQLKNLTGMKIWVFNIYSFGVLNQK